MVSSLSGLKCCDLNSQGVKRRMNKATHILRVYSLRSIDCSLRIWHRDITHLGLDLDLLALAFRERYRWQIFFRAL